MKRLRIPALFLCCLGHTAPVAADGTWALLPDQASCLLNNLDRYQEAESTPIVIFVQACPVVDRLEALKALQQNSSALPSVTIAPDDTPLDQVIVYSAAELECLKDLTLDLSAAPVLLPQSPCAP